MILKKITTFSFWKKKIIKQNVWSQSDFKFSIKFADCLQKSNSRIEKKKRKVWIGWWLVKCEEFRFSVLLIRESKLKKWFLSVFIVILRYNLILLVALFVFINLVDLWEESLLWMKRRCFNIVIYERLWYWHWFFSIVCKNKHIIVLFDFISLFIFFCLDSGISNLSKEYACRLRDLRRSFIIRMVGREECFLRVLLFTTGFRSFMLWKWIVFTVIETACETWFFRNR